IRERLTFLDYAPVCFTSAIKGQGIDDVFLTIDRVAAEARKRVPAHEVSRVIQESLTRRPVTLGGVHLTVQSASQVGIKPTAFRLDAAPPERRSAAASLTSVDGQSIRIPLADPVPPALPAEGAPPGWNLKEFTGRADVELTRVDGTLALRLRSEHSSFALYRD